MLQCRCEVDVREKAYLCGRVVEMQLIDIIRAGSNDQGVDLVLKQVLLSPEGVREVGEACHREQEKQGCPPKNAPDDGPNVALRNIYACMHCMS